MPLEDRFAAQMGRLLAGATPECIGLAVSGGGDSTALMYLAAGWAAPRGIGLRAVTIDHGLRPEAAGEARKVQAQATALGIAHETLRWEGWNGTGNLQDAARRARRRLIGRWGQGLGHVLMGHMMEDQAETVLRNLARGSGVAGLSGMAGVGRLPGPGAPLLLRPLLEMRRQELRDWLTARGIGWSEDPSNADERFERVRARHALAQGNALGLTVEGLAETARRLRRARAALDLRAGEAARRLSRISHGDVVLERAGLATLDEETRFHLLSRALCWVASCEYRPRMRALECAWEAVAAGRAATLHGCVMGPGRGGLRICREWKAVAGLRATVAGPTRWDGRWVISGAAVEGCMIRAVGEDGLRQARAALCGADLPPHVSLLAAPALFRGETLVALPPFCGAACDLVLDPPAGSFTGSFAGM
ncbi:MAG: tRNA lysidine(34) synthetase TilS [Tropicimonas sp.]|uniref:tRNA lysidine(34) synthetase TilS n=1 Tax=Tropicimonas sp. TaxID=2067044 RepID=UPI003A8BB73E